MDPKRLDALASLLGYAASAALMLGAAASWLAGWWPDRRAIRRIAGSPAWPAAAGTATTSWLTALIIREALAGPSDRTGYVALIALWCLCTWWANHVRPGV